MAGEDIADGAVALHGGDPLGAAQLGLAAARRRHPPAPCAGGPACSSSPPAASSSARRAAAARADLRVELTPARRRGGGRRRLGPPLHFVPDDVGQFLATVRAELATADLLITSGSVSAGAFEVVKDAFREPGHRRVR